MAVKFISAASAMLTAAMICLPAFADVHIKSRVLNGMSTTESWISGQKQRTAMQLPMIGEKIMITRLDKGVEWELLPQQKIYSETLLALPYPPVQTPGAADLRMPGGFPGQKGALDPSGLPDSCEPDLKKLADKKKIAGYDADGYQAVCPGEDSSLTLWMIPDPGWGSPIGAIQKESENFNASLMEARYANYPQQERREILDKMKGSAMAAGQGMKGMPQLNALPEGMMAAMEGAGMGENGSPAGGMLFEISELDSKKIDPGFFEIPPGFTLVDDVNQASAQQMLNGMGLSGLGAMMQSLGAEAPPQSSAPADQVPSGMVRKPGPNGWILEPAGQSPEPPQDSAQGRRRPGPNGWVYE